MHLQRYYYHCDRSVYFSKNSVACATISSLVKWFIRNYNSEYISLYFTKTDCHLRGKAAITLHISVDWVVTIRWRMYEYAQASF